MGESRRPAITVHDVPIRSRFPLERSAPRRKAKEPKRTKINDGFRQITRNERTTLSFSLSLPLSHSEKLLDPPQRQTAAKDYFMSVKMALGTGRYPDKRPIYRTNVSSIHPFRKNFQHLFARERKMIAVFPEGGGGREGTLISVTKLETGYQFCWQKWNCSLKRFERSFSIINLVSDTLRIWWWNLFY